MNIFYIGSFRFPMQDAASARVLCNAKILRELGHHVSFISWGGVAREVDKIDGEYIFDGFPYTNTHEIRQSKENFINKIKGYASRGDKTLSLLRKKVGIDLIIAYNTPYHFNKKLSIFCKKKSIELAVDITEWYDANELGSFISPIFFLNEWNMRHTIKGIKNKIVISHFLDDYYAGTNNIILPPMVDLQESKWVKPLPKDIKPFPKGKTFIYAGSPAKKDSLSVILNAFIDIIAKHHRTDFRFFIIGVKDNGHIHNFNKWETIKQHKDNFIFLGRRPQDEIPAFYHIADFSLIVREPSRKNNAGFPTKAAESFAGGCPIIANPTSDLATYIHDYDNGIILKGYDQSSVTEGLLRAMDIDNQKLSSFKQKAKAMGEMHFDFRNYCGQMEKWLEGLSI